MCVWSGLWGGSKWVWVRVRGLEFGVEGLSRGGSVHPEAGLPALKWAYSSRGRPMRCVLLGSGVSGLRVEASEQLADLSALLNFRQEALLEMCYTIG